MTTEFGVESVKGSEPGPSSKRIIASMETISPSSGLASDVTTSSAGSTSETPEKKMTLQEAKALIEEAMQKVVDAGIDITAYDEVYLDCSTRDYQADQDAGLDFKEGGKQYVDEIDIPITPWEKAERDRRAEQYKVQVAKHIKEISDLRKQQEEKGLPLP